MSDECRSHHNSTDDVFIYIICGAHVHTHAIQQEHRELELQLML